MKTTTPEQPKTRSNVPLAARKRHSTVMADSRTRRNRTRSAQQRRAIGEYR